jgi:hypothetical protein
VLSEGDTCGLSDAGACVKCLIYWHQSQSQIEISEGVVRLLAFPVSIRNEEVHSDITMLLILAGFV